MDWNRVVGSWKQLEGKVKAKWGLLTDDDLMTIKGSRELLVGKLQERYGIGKDEARKQIDEYFTSQGYVLPRRAPRPRRGPETDRRSTAL